MQSKPLWWVVTGTLLAMLLTHYSAVLPHEFMHSFAAWAMGNKSDPWNIHWGGGSIGNALLLYNIDENIDSKAAYAAGKNVAVAVAVLAGPGTNAVLYLVARFALPWWRTSTRPELCYVTFWFLFMQLANVYDYVPIRVATDDADVGQWVWATHMSPWWIYVLVGYLVLWAMIDLYRTVLPQTLDASRIEAPAGRAVVLVTVTVMMFGYFAVAGLRLHGVVEEFIARTSVLLIPVVILVNWRRVVSRSSSTSAPAPQAISAATVP